MLTMKWTGDFLRSGPFVTDIEKSSFKCFEIGLKTVLPSQVHTQRITKKYGTISQILYEPARTV